MLNRTVDVVIWIAAFVLVNVWFDGWVVSIGAVTIGVITGLAAALARAIWDVLTPTVWAGFRRRSVSDPLR